MRTCLPLFSLLLFFCAPAFAQQTLYSPIKTADFSITLAHAADDCVMPLGTRLLLGNSWDQFVVKACDDKTATHSTTYFVLAGAADPSAQKLTLQAELASSVTVRRLLSRLVPQSIPGAVTVLKRAPSADEIQGVLVLASSNEVVSLGVVNLYQARHQPLLILQIKVISHPAGSAAALSLARSEILQGEFLMLALTEALALLKKS